VKENFKAQKNSATSAIQKTREEILEATAHLLNRYPLGEVSTNHIARKTGISLARSTSTTEQGRDPDRSLA